MPPEFHGHVGFSLSGYNPHGTTAANVLNVAANVELVKAMVPGLAPHTPSLRLDSFSFDLGTVSWLERGFSLLFPQQVCTPLGHSP